MTTLQERFIESKGAPVNVDGMEVVQMDRIPMRHARLTISAATPRDGEGIAIKAPQGTIKLSDGREVPLLHIWFDAGLPSSATHEVDCRGGELRVWNIYRNTHPSGAITEDAWTGNAGMTVAQQAENRRLYRCSRGNTTQFDPSFEVLLGWEEV
jgi:hypothetical protein